MEKEYLYAIIGTLVGVIVMGLGYALKSLAERQHHHIDRDEERRERSGEKNVNVRVELRALQTTVKSLETRLEAHDSLLELVTRLDERFKAMEKAIETQPKTIAMVVAHAIKTTLQYAPAKTVGV